MINWGHEICPLFEGRKLFRQSVIRGFIVVFSICMCVHVGV